MNQENKAQLKNKGFLEKAKEIVGKLPSISFSKIDPADLSGKRRLKGFFISWRF
jgi:hypothetical protein